MKTSLALILGILLTLCTACSAKEAPPAQESTAPSSSQSVKKDLSPIDEESVETVEPEGDHTPVEQETYELFLSLRDPALTALSWYGHEVAADLLLETDGDYAADDPYRPVGKFATLAEMEAATAPYFTADFCKQVLYEPALEGEALYKEIDGRLYRNIQVIGLEWQDTLTDRYFVSYADDQWRVLHIAADDQNWIPFVLRKEDGAWKFHRGYGLSPWQRYEEAAAPLLFSPVSAYSWEHITDLDPDFLFSTYIYQFLADVGPEYSDAIAYPVPVDEVVANLSRHFDGITREMLLEAADSETGPWNYDGAADAFLFPLTLDPSNTLLLDVEESGENLLFHSLTIAKNDKAVRWSSLTARETDDGLFYLSNRVEEIPEG
jgi:hypothetical protein